MTLVLALLKLLQTADNCYSKYKDMGKHEKKAFEKEYPTLIMFFKEIKEWEK